MQGFVDGVKGPYYLTSKTLPVETTFKVQSYNVSLLQSRNARFGILHRLRLTWKWSNTIIHASGNIGVIFLSLYFLFLRGGSNGQEGIIAQESTS